MQRSPALALGLFFVVLAFASGVANPDDILDTGTARNSMHSCPLGRFVTGVHIIKNQLLCEDSYGNYSPAQEIVDGDDEPPTERDGMHSCPDGMAVTGIHVQKNLLACAPFDPSRVEFGKAGWMPMVDLKTQRRGMHACPNSRPVLGIHEGKDLLRCIDGQGQPVSPRLSGQEGAVGAQVILNEVNTDQYPQVRIFATVLKDGAPLKGLGASEFPRARG
jgi:hypothetical protein